ncbi:hypothetical protein DPMN_000200 [Dreissena polymorpha]|uniref:Uncharacterized protein n=1 Tax=Dreissena polymorpha TaxID=45954 RepID=A0A9D4RRT5_DREPO|nr:hypothetical protein DPMN_000200 [Dreissena polymorpha]
MKAVHQTVAVGTPRPILTKKDFPDGFTQAWDVVATIVNAIHGFRKSGLFPLDPKGIDLSKLEPSKHANPVRNCSDVPEHNSEPSPKPVLPSSAYADISPIEITVCQEDPDTVPNMQPVLQNDIQTLCSTEISIETQNEDTAHCTMKTANSGTSYSVGSATNTLTVIPTATLRNQSYISPAFKLLSMPKPQCVKANQTFN